MAPPGVAQLFLFGEDILNTSVDANTGTILAQLGDVVTGTVDSDNAEFWFPPGFAARPAVPTAGSRAAQVVGMRCSDRDVIVGCRDTRQQKIVGNLKDGETAMFASSGQSLSLWKNTGDWWQVTKVGNAAGGKTLAFHQSADGSFAIQGLAAFLSADANGNITLANGACGITLSSTGTVKVFGKVVQCQASGLAMISGDQFTLLGPKATPVPPTNGCAYSVAGPANIISTNVMVSI